MKNIRKVRTMVAIVIGREDEDYKTRLERKNGGLTSTEPDQRFKNRSQLHARFRLPPGG